MVYPVQSVRFVSPDRNGWETVFVSLCPSDIWVGWGGENWFQAMLDGSVGGFVHTLGELGGASTLGFIQVGLLNVLKYWTVVCIARSENSEVVFCWTMCPMCCILCSLSLSVNGFVPVHLLLDASSDSG